MDQQRVSSGVSFNVTRLADVRLVQSPITISNTGSLVRNVDQTVAHETIKILAYLLSNSYEDNHSSLLIPQSRNMFMWSPPPNTRTYGGPNNSEVTKENVLEMLATTCGILEMLLRHGIVDAEETYKSVGSTLILLLLQVIDRSLIPDDSNQKASRSQHDTNPTLLPEATLGINKALEILCHFSRIQSIRQPLVNIPGLFSMLRTLIEKQATDESLINALCVIGNLAETADLDSAMLEKLLFICKRDVLGKTIIVDGKTEVKPGNCAREQAMRALMNYSASERNRAGFTSSENAIMILLEVVGNSKYDSKTKQNAAATLENLTRSEQITKDLISHGNGVLITTMLEIIRNELSDHEVMRSALGTLSNFAVESALIFVSYPDYLHILEKISCRKDPDSDLALAAAMSLKKLANYLHSPSSDYRESHGFESRSEIHNRLICTLFQVVITVDIANVDVQCQMAKALEIQSANPNNCIPMACNEAAFIAIEKLSTLTDSQSCITAVCTILLNFSAMSLNLACVEVSDALANLVSSIPATNNVILRDMLSLVKQLASTSACARFMSSNERLMVALIRISVRLKGSPGESNEIVSAREIVSILMS